MKIVQATIENLEPLLPLFEKYRAFYKQSPNTDAARSFLTNRFIKKDSIIFIALNDLGVAQGFTQLYPSFSSVSMQRTFILNDLFVHSNCRGKGIGAALMNQAKEYAINKNSKGITLETSVDNPAQKLYERLDWKKDIEVFHYTWEV